jgi:hypothetical protein
MGVKLGTKMVNYIGMRVYATYSGTKDIRPEFAKEGKAGKLQLCWTNVRDECGQPIEDVFSNPADTYHGIKKGGRYVIDFSSRYGNRIKYPKSVKKINKNLHCKLIRKIGDDYIFIKGKFRGKKVSEIILTDKYEFNQYLIWLAENTYNEATIIKVLNILEKINNEK